MSRLLASLASAWGFHLSGVRLALWAAAGALSMAILNVLVWTAMFVGGAAWRFRKDTARV